MKTLIATVFLICTFCWFYGPVTASAHVAPKHDTVPAIDIGFSIQLPAAAPTVVTTKRPQPHKAVATVARTRRFECGPMQPLSTGGSARTCEWR
jgi:hypothetical protein